MCPASNNSLDQITPQAGSSVGIKNLPKAGGDGREGLGHPTLHRDQGNLCWPHSKLLFLKSFP